MLFAFDIKVRASAGSGFKGLIEGFTFGKSSKETRGSRKWMPRTLCKKVSRNSIQISCDSLMF